MVRIFVGKGLDPVIQYACTQSLPSYPMAPPKRYICSSPTVSADGIMQVEPRITPRGDDNNRDPGFADTENIHNIETYSPQL